MVTRFPAHACADYLYDLRTYREGDTIYCRCNRQYTLRPLTLRLRLAWWLRFDFHDGGELVWVRNREAERADRRERTLREREWRRG